MRGSFSKSYGIFTDQLNYHIITDKEPVRIIASRDFTTKKGRRLQMLYKCRKLIKQYYIYFHDAVLGGPCYLKSHRISLFLVNSTSMATTTSKRSSIQNERECIHRCLRSSSSSAGSQYNNLKVTRKTGYFIRTETTINNPKSLGLQKPALFLQACLWFGLGCNKRLLSCCADVDVSTICDGETNPFDHTIIDHNDQKVTPPDFRKDRQLTLCQELLKPKYSVHGFKMADLKRALNQFF
ncbi:MAG: hypothetical protein KKC46_14605 [Proteobacteria bacterium]|nr:hypothetical protein [Pseudomonadota bacterium]